MSIIDFLKKYAETHDDENSEFIQRKVSELDMLYKSFRELHAELKVKEIKTSPLDIFIKTLQHENNSDIQMFEYMAKQLSHTALENEEDYALLLEVKEIINVCMDRKTYLEGIKGGKHD